MPVDSLYVMNTDIVEKHKAELAGLDCGKSCIRFKKIDTLPKKVVKQMLKESAKESKK